jgi:GT2 family glycosyltransferase
MNIRPTALKADDVPDISVVIVNFNTAHLLSDLFTALETSRQGLKLQVIVVDNASRDDSVAILRTRYSDVRLIQNYTNVGFGRANNQAVPLTRGRYVLLLNTDAFVAPDTLHATLDFMEAHPQCGVLGVKLVGRDGTLKPSCRYLPTPWNIFLSSTGLKRLFPRTRLIDDMSWDHSSIRECDWVPGCYYLIRREVLDSVGLFDPRFFLYYEEVDHCRRVREAGWNVIFFPFTKVVHTGGESAVSEGPVTRSGRQISPLQIESQLLYFRKYNGVKGVLSAVFLTLAADTIIACKSLALHRDATKAAEVLRHSCNSLKLLVITRFGSRTIH